MQLIANIGLEIHAQLLTETKLFCRCRNRFGDQPNTHICPVCTGLPGALPVVNEKAVDYTIMIGSATNCQIASVSRFARKNYFYPDLPKGYQITQYENPICTDGWIEYEVNHEIRRVKIKRIHLEEDAGKSIHKDNHTLLDFNRCGIPLIEIVTAADIRGPEEAVGCLAQLKRMLEYLQICDGNMEQGSLRCDCNISLGPQNSSKLGTKVELKNMNSFKAIKCALSYEMKRQTQRLQQHRSIRQETHYWDEHSGQTFPIRQKEETADYRYLPDPDLPVLFISNERIDQCQNQLPELPLARYKRFAQQYALKTEICEILTRQKAFADYFETVNQIVDDPILVSKWMVNELLEYLKKRSINIQEYPVSASRFARFLISVKRNDIPKKRAKTILSKMIDSDTPLEVIIEKYLPDNTLEIDKIIREVIQENPDEYRRLSRGESKFRHYFIGKIMAKTEGQLDPQSVIDRLQNWISNQSDS